MGLFGLSFFLLITSALTTRTVPIKQMGMNKEEAAIARCYDTMYQCMITKDTMKLSSLLCDEFVLIHMTGMTQSKSEYMRCIADGTLNYFSCNGTQLEIFIDRDSARIIGRSRVDAAVFGGGRHTWALQLDMNLSKRDGRWLFTRGKASTY